MSSSRRDSLFRLGFSEGCPGEGVGSEQPSPPRFEEALIQGDGPRRSFEGTERHSDRTCVQTHTASGDIAISEKDWAIGEKDRAIAEKDMALAEKDRVIAEKDMAIEAKDRMILVLEQDKEAFKEEMVFVIKGSITILQDVSEQVLDLAMGLQKFKLKNENEETTTIPSAPSSSQETPSTLLSCGEEVSKKIYFAQCTLDEALKKWKKAEAGLEILQNYNRKFVLAKILGKEEPAPISDAGEETTVVLHQVDQI